MTDSTDDAEYNASVAESYLESKYEEAKITYAMACNNKQYAQKLHHAGKISDEEYCTTITEFKMALDNLEKLEMTVTGGVTYK